MAVPLMAVGPRLGAAGLAAAIVLILLERTGKAIRSPAKSALLADAAGSLARGRGFGVHKALDQTGAFAGPLLVAAVIAGAGTLWPGFAVLAVPGALAPDPAGLPAPRGARPRRTGPTRNHPGTAAAPGSSTTPALPPASAATHSDPPPRPGRGWIAAATGGNLPRAFVTYAVATSLTTGGLVTFGALGYHLTTLHVIATSALHRTGHCCRADPSPRARCACDLAGRPSRL